MVILAECLLYLCFSYLMGSFLFASLSPSKRPDLLFSRRLSLFTTIGAGLLSFFPILFVILKLSKTMGIWLSLKEVLFTFQIGQAWVLTFSLSVLLFFLIFFNPIKMDSLLTKIGLILTTLLIGSYVKSGYAASVSPVWGFITHFIHLLAVSIWGGCLLLSAWRTKSDDNWLPYLKWFTPFAILSILVIIFSGFITMVVDLSPLLHKTIFSSLENYKNGLITNYGQALLIKNLLMVPLILLTLFNGFYTQGQLERNKPMNPIRWVRLESLLLFAVLVATAFMNHEPPPQDLSQVVHFYGESPLFQVIHGIKVLSPFTVQLHFDMISLVFGCCSLFMLILICFGLVKKQSRFMISGFIFSYLISSYLAVVLALK